MNEMASQVIFERLPCLHGNLDACRRGRNAGGEENQRTDMIYMQWTSTEIPKL